MIKDDMKVRQIYYTLFLAMANFVEYRELTSVNYLTACVIGMLIYLVALTSLSQTHRSTICDFLEMLLFIPYLHHALVGTASLSTYLILLLLTLSMIMHVIKAYRNSKDTQEFTSETTHAIE